MIRQNRQAFGFGFGFDVMLPCPVDPNGHDAVSVAAWTLTAT
ncbi:hypothetical protein ACFZA1_38860 [Streptomyces filipinensis]